MVSFRRRQVVSASSITAFLIISYTLSYISLRHGAAPGRYLDVLPILASGYNIAIILSWIGFGMAGGVAVTAISFLVVILAGLRVGVHSYSLFAPPFFIASLIGYGYWIGGNHLRSTYLLRSEKMDEELNMLFNGIKEKEASIGSLEEKLRRYSKLKQAIEAMSSVLSVEAIGKMIIDDVTEAIGKDGRILLFLVDPERQELMLSASRDTYKIKAKKGDVFDSWVLRHRKPLIVEDVQRDYRFPASDVERSSETFRALISTPLISQNKVIGVLRMDCQNELAYAQDDLRLLDIIADLGAVSIQNAMLYTRTQELAIRDGLTGVFVRRYFFDRFHEELKRASRKNSQVCILMMDIDNFKKYNDKYGHTAGDLILKHLSQTLSSMVREGDIVCRYGGEEFTVLLYGRGPEEGKAEAEAIRKAVEEKPLLLRRKQAGITVSIGVSMYPKDAVSEVELIRIADERLYEAKNKGRNRVCSG